MTKTNLVPGDQIHFVASGLSFAINAQTSGARTSERGMTITVTEALIEAATDRLGHAWLDLVDDPAGQEARWGKEVFRRGPAPEGMVTWTYGSPEWSLARESARREAWAAPESQRAEALAEVQRKYGDGPSTAAYGGEALYR
jgi:hypothetical protein